MSELPPLVFIYAAKSTKDTHLSIPEQVEDCREMALDPDVDGVWEIAINPATGADYWTDENFTAYTGNRGPALADVIRRAKEAGMRAGRKVFIASQHTSRFARGNGDKPDAPRALVELWHEWARSNVSGRTVENDSAMSSSANAAAQGEADHNDSKRKGKSVRKGLRRRAERGKLAGGLRPFGYAWVGPTSRSAC